MNDEERQRYEYERAHRAAAQTSEQQVATDDARVLRGLLNAVRDALGPTCADATNAALPGLVRTVVQCDAATHEWCDEQRERLREMAAEVAHLEARRGALLAEVDRLTAAQYVGGGNAEDWRALAVENGDGWSKTTNELLAAREALATARLDGAREMRERAALLEALAADTPADIIDAIRALPLPGEEVARG